MTKIKIIIMVCAISTSLLTYAQVGIGTSNPRTTFHIDGAKDNPPTGEPSEDQQINDFSVTSDAKVGIGIVSPTEKLDVASGNVRIRDINSNTGARGQDKIEVSDFNGVLKTIDPFESSMFHERLVNK